MAIFRRLLFDSVIFTYLSLVLIVAWIKPSEEELLDLSRNFKLTISLGFIWFGIGGWLMIKKIETLGGLIFYPIEKERGYVLPWWRRFWGWTLTITILVTLWVGFHLTQFSFYELTNREGFRGALRLLSGIINPNFQILPKAVLAIIETVYIAFIATALAVPVAFFLSFFCAKNIMGQTFLGLIFYSLLRGIFNIMRSVEPFIWAIIFSIWVGIGPFAGMLALMVHTIASLVKQYSEQIECVDEGPIEGIESTGAKYLQVLWYAIVPQVFLPFVAFTIYRWDINVRMATVIGLVGGGGIGTLLIQYQGVAMWEEVGCIALVIVGVVWIMDLASASLRHYLRFDS